MTTTETTDSPIPAPATDEFRAEFRKLWNDQLARAFVNLAGQNTAAAEHVAWAAFRAGRKGAKET